MKNKILFVLVVYKMSITETQTFQGLLDDIESSEGNIELYIYDNSPEEQPVPKVPFINITYHHDSHNSGVSKAYNEAAFIAERKGLEWLAIFDQDTSLPSGILESYGTLIDEAGPTDFVFAPKLYDRERLVSPCYYIFHRGFQMKTVSDGKLNLRRRSFLNSGLLIKKSLLALVNLFDERLFDYSDHDFFYRATKVIDHVNVIDVELEHSLSSSDNTNEQQVFDRLLMLKSASLRMAKKHRSIFPVFWFTLRAIKLFFITKNPKFIKVIVK